MITDTVDSLFDTGGVIMLLALSLNLRFLVSVSVLPEAVCENIYWIPTLQAYYLTILISGATNFPDFLRHSSWRIYCPHTRGLTSVADP
jgi:hypothetical protein